MNEKRTVWRWAPPSKKFYPHEHIYYRGVKFRTHNKTVLAGLRPTDWLWIGRGQQGTLHKIVLIEEQCKKCVVAEGNFQLTDDELTEFRASRGLSLAVGLRTYERENFEDSFVPLLDYQGGYNCPEVLIPFPVDAQIMWLYSYYVKMKVRYFAKHLFRPPSRVEGLRIE
jgi:hypothetical protein